MQIKMNRALVLAGMLLLELPRVQATGIPASRLYASTLTYNDVIALSEALEKIQQSCHVNFNYSNAVVANKFIPATALPEGNNFNEANLSSALQPLGLALVKLAGSDYAIRPVTKMNVTNPNAYTFVDHKVSGVITSDKDEPIPGAVITNKTTGKAVVTDAAGRYTIDVDNAATVLTVRCIGFVPRELKAGSSSMLNAQLMTDVKNLSSVVVTALGIKRSEKSVGYAMTTLDGSKVNTVKDVNVANGLSGKVAGLEIRSVSSDPGAAVMVTIRGNSSLNGEKRPLFVVDGVPINSTNLGAKAPVGQVVVDYGSPISDVNPDDIATISVLKGGAAAALYGSRGANGVILITTKSGNGGRKGLDVDVNFSALYDQAWQFPEFQNEFGAGDATDAVDPTNTLSTASWGPRLNQGTKHLQWNSPTDKDGNLVATDWISYPNRVKDYFQTGATYTSNVAVNGKDFRLSYTNMSNKGITPNTDLTRNTLNLAASRDLNKNIRVSSNIAYANNHSNNRPTFNRGSAESIVYTMPANINTKLLKNYWEPGLEGLQQFSQDLGSTDNPYFVAHELTNGYERNRITGDVQVNINLTKDLTLMGRTGLDYYNQTEESKRAFSAVQNKLGGYYIGGTTFMEQNTDFLLTYKKTLNSDWAFNVSAGANHMNTKTTVTSQSAGSLVVPGLYNISNGAAGTIANLSRLYKKQINSIYGMGELSFRNYAFLNLTARNDYSSSLPIENDSYFYPSASLSVVLTDMLHLHSNVLSFAKARVNWSRIGDDTDPYQLNNSYVFMSPDWGNVKLGNMNNTILSNHNLKPEILSSKEYGLDLRFFDGRITLDAAYYDADRRNQIMNIPVTGTTGYSAMLVNAGEIRNRGWEISLGGTPVNKQLIWDAHVNFTRNRNMVMALRDDVPSYLRGSAEGVQYQIKAGRPLGDFYGRTWTTVPDGPYKGKELLDNTGHSQQTNDFVRIGNYNADYMVGITNTFTYKHFTLNTLIDWRQGGQFFSYVYMNLLSDGRTTNTLKGRDAAHGGLAWNDGTNDRHDGMIEDGYIDNGDGTYVKNTNITDPESYYGDYYWKMHARNTFSATYVKLREVSLTYQFSKSQLGRLPVNNLSLAFIARNLFSWTAAGKGYDPETSMTITNGGITPGTTSWTLPYTRSYGVKLGVNF